MPTPPPQTTTDALIENNECDDTNYFLDSMNNTTRRNC